MNHHDIGERMDRERSIRSVEERERKACVSFLELLADAGAYAEASVPWPELLRRVASHMREREKWEAIMQARRDAKKPLPWEPSK